MKDELEEGDVRLTEVGTLYCILSISLDELWVKLYIIDTASTLVEYAPSKIVKWGKHYCEADKLISKMC